MERSSCQTATDGQDVGVLPVRVEGERILLVDQRNLPDKLSYFDATELEDMCFAIREMVVRGAPSIGVAAALGLARHAKKLAEKENNLSANALLDQLNQASEKLKATRPTAVNLKWATDKICQAAKEKAGKEPSTTAIDLAVRLFELAVDLLDMHIKANIKLSSFGKSLIPNNSSVLTHCNAGSLATCGWGTALGVVRSAKFAGLIPQFTSMKLALVIKAVALPSGN